MYNNAKFQKKFNCYSENKDIIMSLITKIKAEIRNPDFRILL